MGPCGSGKPLALVAVVVVAATAVADSILRDCVLIIEDIETVTVCYCQEK